MTEAFTSAVTVTVPILALAAGARMGTVTVTAEANASVICTQKSSRKRDHLVNRAVAPVDNLRLSC